MKAARRSAQNTATGLDSTPALPREDISVDTLNHQPHENHSGREEYALLIATSILSEPRLRELTPDELRDRCPRNSLAAAVADAMDALLSEGPGVPAIVRQLCTTDGAR
jgi:hypothetical protein